jgi:hypothetical protein
LLSHRRGNDWFAKQRWSTIFSMQLHGLKLGSLTKTHGNRLSTPLFQFVNARITPEISMLLYHLCIIMQCSVMSYWHMEIVVLGWGGGMLFQIAVRYIWCSIFFWCYHNIMIYIFFVYYIELLIHLWLL